MHALLRPPSPTLTPSALLRGPHTPVKLRLPEHQSIHSPEPPGVYWKHTQKHWNGRDGRATEGRLPHQEQIEGKVSGNTISQFTSALEFFDIPFPHICFIHSLLAIKAFSTKVLK